MAPRGRLAEAKGDAGYSEGLHARPRRTLQRFLKVAYRRLRRVLDADEDLPVRDLGIVQTAPAAEASGDHEPDHGRQDGAEHRQLEDDDQVRPPGIDRQAADVDRP